mgnify:FL=1
MVLTAKECQKMREKLCERYKRKCLTGGCPLAKLPNFCYEHQNFVEWYRTCPPSGKRKIIRVMKMLRKEEAGNND